MVDIAKNRLSEETRNAMKLDLGIEPNNSRNKCRSCYYHPYNDICNKHHIRTNDDDSCKHFKRDTKFKFTNGGSMSPR